MKTMTFARWAFSGVLLTLSPTVSPRPAVAITVYDPSNFVKNTITSLNTIKSNVNEGLMLVNQVKSLANEIKNLEKLDFSILDDFSSQMNDLFEVAGTINGLMQDFSNVQDQFQELYPDLAEIEGFNVEQMANETERWLTANRDAVLGAARTGAQILENLPRSQAQLDELLTQSQGAEGIVQAAQAGNQIAANMAGNLQALNAQFATYTQAHMNHMMQETQQKQSAIAIGKDAMKSWGKKL